MLISEPAAESKFLAIMRRKLLRFWLNYLCPGKRSHTWVGPMLTAVMGVRGAPGAWDKAGGLGAELRGRRDLRLAPSIVPAARRRGSSTFRSKPSPPSSRDAHHQPFGQGAAARQSILGFGAGGSIPEGSLRGRACRESSPSTRPRPGGGGGFALFTLQLWLWLEFVKGSG